VAHPHPEPLSGATYSAVELMPDDRRVVLLDQRALPSTERYDTVTSVAEVARAIEQLMVRGAPAIGIAAAYGMVLAAASEPGPSEAFVGTLERAGALLGATRPTAVNLAWALGRMGAVARAVAAESPANRVSRLAADARSIHREDVASCRAMGRIGSARIRDGATVLTHCNAGALATGGYGTALGVVRAAREAGKAVRVIACETRPVLQGARLTAWELSRDGFDVTIVTDSMVAQLLRRRAVDLVVVGADRVARSGDVANKIGTYGLACLSEVHGIPFYVAAPWSTVDLECPNGDAIPIEQRSEDEVLSFAGTRVAPSEVRAENPAFDVTPARLVAALFTERGEASPLSEHSLRSLAPC
jgi:methylthioribose-1-phosphate isomerase